MGEAFSDRIVTRARTRATPMVEYREAVEWGHGGRRLALELRAAERGVRARRGAHVGWGHAEACQRAARADRRRDPARRQPRAPAGVRRRELPADLHRPTVQSRWRSVAQDAARARARGRRAGGL